MAREGIALRRQPGAVRPRRAAFAAWLLLAMLARALGMQEAAPEARAESTVGVPARIDQLVLPGSELEVAAGGAQDEIVLRILATWPHGTAFRYDLEYWALEPGEHDLRAFLRRKDGSGTADLPPIPVVVRSLLPPGRIRPHAPDEGEVPAFGGYRALLAAAGVAWAAGLAWLLLARRERRRDETQSPARPPTLAERLRPLVERALQGQLSRGERAQLELGLVAHWRRRLGLDERRPEEALALLREHPQAGPLLNGLEDWLHRPDPAAEVDVAELLAPYRDLAPDSIDLPQDPRARRADAQAAGG
jgi:hypothetical protein